LPGNLIATEHGCGLWRAVNAGSYARGADEISIQHDTRVHRAGAVGDCLLDQLHHVGLRFVNVPRRVVPVLAEVGPDV